jgi:uncharacterized SCP-like protein
MPSTKPIAAAEVRAALHPVLDWLDTPVAEPDRRNSAEPGEPTSPERPTATPDRRTLATAVRTSLRAFAQQHPGKSVEVRVPPFAVVQCLAGATHTRGTPPHVVETDPRTWLLLVTGRIDWATALESTQLRASGHRADEIGALLPLKSAT